MSKYTQGSLAVVGAIALAIFLISLIALMTLGDYSFIPATFLALLIALLAAIILYLGFGNKLNGFGIGGDADSASAAAGSAAPVSGASSSSTSGMSASDASVGPADDDGSSGASEEVAVSDPMPEVSSEPESAPEPEPTRAAEPDPTPAPEPEPTPELSPSPTPAPAAAPVAAAASADVGKDYDGDGVLEGKNEGTRPSGLDAPRDGKADDLKQIKGVGPKMEKICNSLGFWHFDQVANWSADEVAWVDANLEGFAGRVTRDAWVEQAKILAAGGETEFSKRVEGGDVY